MVVVRWAFLFFGVVGCSAAAGPVSDTDGGNGASDSSVKTPDAAGVGDASPLNNTVAARQYFVNAASIANTSDIRVCAQESSARALPTSNRIPRTNYPGIPVGGFAEIGATVMFDKPFVIDAFKLAKFEESGPLPCSTIHLGLQYTDVPAPKTAPTPGVFVLTGTSPFQIVSFDVAPMVSVRGAQIGIASPSLAMNWDLTDVRVSFGPIDGKCASEVYAGAIAPNTVVPTNPLSFPMPVDMESQGLQICAKNKMTMKLAPILQQSYASLQAVSMPETVPSELYASAPLYFFLVLGDEAAPEPERKLHALVLPFPVTH